MIIAEEALRNSMSSTKFIVSMLNLRSKVS
jgi:hypothetical protein